MTLLYGMCVVVVTSALALGGSSLRAANGQAAPSPDIHYIPTPPAVVDAMLKIANVTAADVVYDLGSGDGRIPIVAAQKFGARGLGIELDPALISRAREAARKSGVADRVSFVQADLFKTDLSDATVVTLYLSPSINLRLRSKLRALRPGTRIVSHRFEIPEWMADQHLKVDGRDIYFWTVR